jgi:GNAT superfamily N-acetyltransferase
VPTEALDIIDLKTRHLAGALALSREAHWNQVEIDWSMMFAAGNAIGIEDSQGRLIASALTLPYGDRFGWISMVLVTADRQKQGLATRLLKTCIERLEDQGLVAVLDATAAGENVYRPLGFLPQFGFQRWEHEAVQNISLKPADVTGVQNIRRGDAAKLIGIDAAVFGGDRQIIVENLIERSANFACMSDDQSGFAVGRNGRVATQIGPISAKSSATAVTMLNHALKALTGPVFIDACDHQEAFAARLQEIGFRPQRPFLRMAKGTAESFGAPDNMFAMAGPELG